MFFRVRASLTDRPGALASLASTCGDAGLNILGLQLFPDLGKVTDELVISTPEGWTARAVAELVGGAGGDEVSVEPCTTHDLIDQPTRWLAAAQDVVGDPTRLPELLDKLLGPHPERWTATEHSRAGALTALAEAGGPDEAASAGGRPRSAGVSYAVSPTGLVARIGGHTVGVATVAPTEAQEVTIEVAPAWRRLGIGSALLQRACDLVAERGLAEMVLLAPAEDEGFVSMVCSTGMRARIRVTQGVLQARIPLAGHGARGSTTPVG
ncbi:GNAT family N-acetyltransferase [Nocardioides aurantiacus]|uniref:Acetyltransferase (GNAT) family protein n=1 Tax=Nocardioides aurantiacus TaxID=86796 RepID=A0A3N2CQW3_9ACTN|nr:GNAT family N-acetyltransferase [Nocardioides aurantiacus]ROR89714.1 acetyltransferase (GNAT) family protein [Nocardioides aurantiacus]